MENLITCILLNDAGLLAWFELISCWESAIRILLAIAEIILQ